MSGGLTPVVVSGSLGRDLQRLIVRMADLGQGFQAHASAADGSFVVLLEEDGADQSCGAAFLVLQ